VSTAIDDDELELEWSDNEEDEDNDEKEEAPLKVKIFGILILPPPCSPLLLLTFSFLSTVSIILLK
jgi:hypothetical protein